MFDIEAKAIADILESYGPALQNKIILDIGSSTGRYRAEKPQFRHLHEAIVAVGGAYIGLDLKDADGVDLVGDVTTASTLCEIKKMAPKVVLLNNVLEHLEDPWKVLQDVWEAIPNDGVLVVSVPMSYPYHPDPIDTMFRPCPEEIVTALMGATSVVAKVLEDRTLLSRWGSRGAGYMLYRICRSLAKFAFKSAFDSKHLLYSDFRWFFRRVSVSLVAVEKKRGA